MNIIDTLIINFDKTLKGAFGSTTTSTRPSPALNVPEAILTEEQRQHSAGLMRINHVGEVCAQALYQGQALTARTNFIQKKLEQAAEEEQDHLAWCKQRIHELGGRTSYLNPFWYTASLAIGVIAGLAGDAINLGFLAETEHQVEKHLTDHLEKIDLRDEKSRKILEQMRLDESQHALTAESAGAAELPDLIKALMRCFSKLMTTTVYWV